MTRASVSRPLRGRVVLIRSENAIDDNDQVDSTVLEQMLDRAVAALGGVNDPREVWRDYYSPEDRVGLKVSCLPGPSGGRPVCTHNALTDLVIRRLTDIGVNPGNIVIWDRSNADLIGAGYKIRQPGNQPACLGCTDTKVGYSNDIYVSRTAASCLARFLTRLCTRQVSLPVMKDHGIVGVTGALKTWLGGVHNPNKYHPTDGHAVMIADLNLLPEIRNAQGLIICDVLNLLYYGGPSYKPRTTARYGGLLVATDPVALDRVGWKLIDEHRTANGFPLLENDPNADGMPRKPDYILTAGDKEHNLGEAALDRVKLLEMSA